MLRKEVVVCQVIPQRLSCGEDCRLIPPTEEDSVDGCKRVWHVYKEVRLISILLGVEMAQQGSLQKKLQSLSLDDVKEIGKELGRGAYGMVVEVRVSGLVCAGKTLHEAIVQVHILDNDEMITISCYLFVE